LTVVAAAGDAFVRAVSRPGARSAPFTGFASPRTPRRACTDRFASLVFIRRDVGMTPPVLRVVARSTPVFTVADVLAPSAFAPRAMTSRTTSCRRPIAENPSPLARARRAMPRPSASWRRRRDVIARAIDDRSIDRSSIARETRAMGRSRRANLDRAGRSRSRALSERKAPYRRNPRAIARILRVTNGIKINASCA